jgi:hypothetical protein
MISSSKGSAGWKLARVWANNPSRFIEIEPLEGMRQGGGGGHGTVFHPWAVYWKGA